jgi:hypothetical protein
VYRLEILIEGLPLMNNNSTRGKHWSASKKEADFWKRAVMFKVGVHKPMSPLHRYRLTLIRCSSVEPDFDGIVRGGKHLVDGLRHAGVIADDKISNTGQWNCLWEKVAPGKGHIKLIVEEVCG